MATKSNEYFDPFDRTVRCHFMENKEFKMNNEGGWNYEFRLRNKFRSVGVLAGLMSTLIWLVGLYGVITEVKEPIGLRLFQFLFISIGLLFFISLSVYLVASFYRNRLLMKYEMIRTIGVFRTKKMLFDSVERVEWRKRPVGGSVVLRNSECRIVIEMDSYSYENRVLITDLINDRIPMERHLNWREYYEHFYVDTPEKSDLSMSKERILIAAFFIFALMFSIVSWLGMGNHFLVISGINFAVAIYSLKRYRDRKRDEEKNDAN